MEEDWDIEHYPYILTYCNIIPNNDNLYWQSWLSYRNSILIGICGLYEDIKKRMWMGWFGVLPSQRKKGYGNVLLNYMEYKTKQLGYNNLYCYCTDEPLGFYKKNGYQKLLENEYNIIKKSL